MTKALVVSVGVAACLLLSGCAGASTPLPPPPTEAEITAVMTKYTNEQANQFGDAYPEIWENVEFVRFIDISESEQFVGECTRGFGVTTVTFDEIGNMSWADDSGTDFVSTVVNACSLMYPNEVWRSQVRTDAQAEYLYNYTSTFLQPCLAAAGFVSEKPPSRKVFLADSDRNLYSWTPYNSITVENVAWGNYDEDPKLYESNLAALMARCPMFPEGLEPWGM